MLSVVFWQNFGGSSWMVPSSQAEWCGFVGYFVKLSPFCGGEVPYPPWQLSLTPGWVHLVCLTLAFRCILWAGLFCRMLNPVRTFHCGSFLMLWPMVALVCFCLGGGSLLDELINHRFFLVLLVSVSTLQLLSRVLGLCWCLQGLPVVYCSSGRNIWTHCSVLLYNNSKNRDIH